MKGNPLHLTAVLIVFLVLPLGAESLWDSDFSGYISENPTLKVGSTLQVLLISPLTLQYEASRVTSERVDVTFTGGEQGKDPLGFLPRGETSEDQSVTTEAEGDLRGALTVQVVEVLDDGSCRIRGSRSLEIDGLRESVQVEGILHSHDLTPEGIVSFDKLVDGKMVISTMLSGAEGTLSVPDVAALETEGLAAEKKRELLLQYLNRFLDVVFPQ